MTAPMLSQRQLRAIGLVDLGHPRGIIIAALYRRCRHCNRLITIDTPIRGRYCQLDCWELALRLRFRRVFGVELSWSRAGEFTRRCYERPLIAARRQHGLPEFRHYPEEKYPAYFEPQNDPWRALGPEYALQDDVETMHEQADEAPLKVS